MVLDSWLAGALVINSTSPMLLWHLSEKCLATVFVRSGFWMSPKSLTNLSITLMDVCPTYCTPHLVHVIQYIKLKLLHDMDFMQSYSFPVVLLMIRPLLFRSGQYLQVFVLLQVLKPLLRGSVPYLGFISRGRITWLVPITSAEVGTACGFG